MRLINLIGLLMTCLLFGCAIFKKDKTLVDASTLPVVAVDSSAVDSLTMIPESYDLVLADTIVPPPLPKQPLAYMTIEEKAMIEEINLLRADPNSYIQYIDAYIQDVMADANFDFSSRQTERNAGEELIRELRFMPPLPLLRPSEELYKVAKKHGKDMKENKMINHRGSDNSLPEDRIRDSTHLIGSENLVAAGRSVRESVIMLLVDAKDSAGREHRKTILNPAWEFIACFAAGTVSEVPNTWVQLLGYKDPNDVPREAPIRSIPSIDIKVHAEPQISKPAPARPIPVPEPVSAPEVNNKTTQVSGDFSFMTAEEKAMIEEINLMRADPKGYIKYVDEFIATERKNIQGELLIFDSYAKELKEQLRKTNKLSSLKPHKELYEVAKAHGLYNKKNHQMEHLDAEGKEGFDRVEKTGLKNSINSKGEYAPNENLVYGYASVRNTVIYLLIDEGEPSRGHRKALLEPTWEYVACYYIGMVEKMRAYPGSPGEDAPHNWIQFFAMD
jgi:uncharacterized protein YkwD